MSNTEVQVEILTEEEWHKRFKPIVNPYSSDEDTMFETYGEELEYVLNIAKTEPNRVWTYTDEGIYPSYFLFNRLGYFITEVPWKEEEQWTVWAEITWEDD